MRKRYRVTHATIYTVRPVVTAHRFQVIERTEPTFGDQVAAEVAKGPGPFAKFVGWVIGVPLGLWFGNWLVVHWLAGWPGLFR
jgi:hypothetical protein